MLLKKLSSKAMHNLEYIFKLNNFGKKFKLARVHLEKIKKTQNNK